MARTDCPICQGSGWKVVERSAEGAQPLATDKPGGSSGEPKMVWAVPCDCTTGNNAERVLARARVPDRYRHCDFENFETDNEIEDASREQLGLEPQPGAGKLVVQRFAENFLPSARCRTTGLLLMGPAAWARRIWPSPR